MQAHAPGRVPKTSAILCFAFAAVAADARAEDVVAAETGGEATHRRSSGRVVIRDLSDIGRIGRRQPPGPARRGRAIARPASIVHPRPVPARPIGFGASNATPERRQVTLEGYGALATSTRRLESAQSARLHARSMYRSALGRSPTTPAELRAAQHEMLRASKRLSSAEASHSDAVFAHDDASILIETGGHLRRPPMTSGTRNLSSARHRVVGFGEPPRIISASQVSAPPQTVGFHSQERRPLAKRSPVPRRAIGFHAGGHVAPRQGVRLPVGFRAP